MDLTQVTQHVKNLYDAARLAPLSAKEHEIVFNSAKELDKYLNDLRGKKPPTAPPLKVKK